MPHVLVLSLLVLSRDFNLELKLFVMFEEILLQYGDGALFRGLLHDGVDVELHVADGQILMDRRTKVSDYVLLLFNEIVLRSVKLLLNLLLYDFGSFIGKCIVRVRSTATYSWGILKLSHYRRRLLFLEGN